MRAQGRTYAKPFTRRGDMISGSPGEITLAKRFLRDVRAIDGPQWNKPIPPENVTAAVYKEWARRSTLERNMRYAAINLESPEEGVRLGALEFLKKGGERT